MVGRHDAMVEILRQPKARTLDDIVLEVNGELGVESKPAPLKPKGAAPDPFLRDPGMEIYDCDELRRVSFDLTLATDGINMTTSKAQMQAPTT